MRFIARLEGTNAPERAPFLSRLVIALIVLYQRRISPVKGFRCAHRALYGGPSCSTFIKERIAAEGVVKGWHQARARFATCHTASRELQILMAENGRANEPGKSETPEERTKRCAALTPATCCLTGFVFH